jgi:DNA-binding LacI/PurR family transcriptional regulator
MGKTAASVLFKALLKKNVSLQKETIVVPSVLIVRNSTG